MKSSNKHIIRGLVLLVFTILAYSCDNGCKQKTTFADILKSDSVELNNIIETLRNRNIDFISIIAGRYEAKNIENNFPWSFILWNNDDSIAIGGMVIEWDSIEWDSIELRNHRRSDYPDSTLLDTLNMMNDFKEVLHSFKSIAGDDYLVLLEASTIIFENPQLSSEVVNNYVEVLLYYKKEHYLVVYAKEDELYEILNYRKKRPYYNDLDIDNQCQRLYGDVYLVGFYSQDSFFKNR